jgi:hypothetical protein
LTPRLVSETESEKAAFIEAVGEPLFEDMASRVEAAANGFVEFVGVQCDDVLK